ncbi:hypothetical protein [Massilia phyllosphaerae]|uniref:hypothetical protein n=1 Tax=Massilia phyllosphaerae TaxID=3106034 RepID=UPI002B1CD9B9|nr:hypothetical protein [Massilia sp. SGZ-792]
MIEDFAPFVCLLTDNETDSAFCLRYWALDVARAWSEPFDNLLADSGLSKWEMTTLLKSACRAYLPHLRCGLCRNPLEVGSRSNYSPRTGSLIKFGKRLRPPLCSACDKAARVDDLAAHFFQVLQHRDRVNAALKQLHESARPLDFSKLNYVQSFFLYSALVAANAGPDNRVIPPLQSQSEALAPSAELTNDIYVRLYMDRILLPYWSSNPDAISLEKETGALTFNIRTCAWMLPHDVTGRSIDEILLALFQRLDQPDPKAVEELWYLVAVEECKRYFISQCERFRFIHPSIYSSNVDTSIRHYLDRCSIGQMWNIIHYSIKNLAALAQEGKYTRQHIYNMIPGTIRRCAEYRLAKDEEIHPWRRPSLTKESWITSILLDKVLKNGEASFEMLKGSSVVKYVERMFSNPCALFR